MAVINWYTSSKHEFSRLLVGSLFVFVALLNVLWKVLFFVAHRIDLAWYTTLGLEFTIIALIALLWRTTRSGDV